jgi:hypothetical protein
MLANAYSRRRTATEVVLLFVSDLHTGQTSTDIAAIERPGVFSLRWMNVIYIVTVVAIDGRGRRGRKLGVSVVILGHYFVASEFQVCEARGGQF